MPRENPSSEPAFLIGSRLRQRLPLFKVITVLVLRLLHGVQICALPINTLCFGSKPICALVSYIKCKKPHGVLGNFDAIGPIRGSASFCSHLRRLDAGPALLSRIRHFGLPCRLDAGSRKGLPLTSHMKPHLQIEVRAIGHAANRFI
jgi:hypothetical protein